MIHSLRRFASLSFATTILWLIPFGMVRAASSFDNPLNSNFSSIPAFIAGALRILVMIGLPIISLFVVYSGFMFLMAQGNPGEIKKAKDNFVYVIIGAILILGAWVIATLIGGTVSQLTTG